MGGHVAFPLLDELTTLTVKFPNFFVDTSAYTLRRLPAEFVAYMRSLGADRVMFGTHWPMIPHAKCLDSLDALALGEKGREALLSGNARRVLKL